MVIADAAGFTIGLLITFGGLGLVVNGIVIYIVIQAMGERAENRRRGAGAGGEGESAV